MGASYEIIAGSLSQMVEVTIRDSTTGQGKTGVAHTDVTARYIRQGTSAGVSITMASGTLGTWSSGGWVVVDATNSPGRYQFGIPNAALVAGVGAVKLTFKISGAIDKDVEIKIDDGTAKAAQRAIAGAVNSLMGDGNVPDWFNLERAACRIKYGWANTLWIGDSQSAGTTTPRILSGIIRTWDVRFVGLHIPASAQVDAEGYSTFFTGAIGTSESSEILPSSTSGGITNNTALGMRVGTLSNIANSTPFLDVYLKNLDVYNQTGLPPRMFSDGDWTVKNRLKYAILYAKHGSSDLTDININTRRGSESYLQTTPISMASAAAGHSRIEYHFPTPTSTLATETRCYWGSASASESEAGKVFAHTGHLIFVEGAQSGYSHAAIAVGGWATTDHLSPLNTGEDASYYGGVKLTVTDAAATGTTNLSSATGGFTSAHLNCLITVTGQGTRTITAIVDTNNVTCQSAWGTFTGGTANVLAGKYTQAQLVTTLGLLRNPNVFFVMIGTNIGVGETGSGSAAAYKANVETILARYRAACTSASITDAQFVLIAPWQTGSDSSDDADTRAYRDAQAQALYEIAVAAPADVGFINLHQIIKRRLGSYSIWQSTYLADFVHPTTLGATTFMGYVWDALSEAAAAAAIAGVAATQGRKIDLIATKTPATVTTGSLIHRIANKNTSKTYDQSTDSLEAIAEATGSGSGGASAADVWTYATRTLTGPAPTYTPIHARAQLRLIKGESYGSNAVKNIAIGVTNGGTWPTDLSDYTWTFVADGSESATSGVTFSGTVAVTTATGSTRAVQVTIAASTTSSLAAGQYIYALQGTKTSGGQKVVPQSGSLLLELNAAG